MAFIASSSTWAGVRPGSDSSSRASRPTTTGAENDIEQATNLARTMVTRWGMSEKLGLVQLALCAVLARL